MTWSNLHEKAVCDGEISSEPFVKGDEVYVSFESGLEWRVPHLVPDDLKRRAEGFADDRSNEAEAQAQSLSETSA